MSSTCSEEITSYAGLLFSLRAGGFFLDSANDACRRFYKLKGFHKAFRGFLQGPLHGVGFMSGPGCLKIATRVV